MEKKSRTEYSILNIFTGVGGYIFNVIFSLVNRMIFVRCLSADYLGVNGLFSNILSMLTLAELGIGGAVVYALYKPLAEEDYDKVATLMKLYSKAYRIIGFVVAGCGLCLLPFLNLIITEKPNIQENIYLLYLISLFNTAITYFFSYKSSLLIAAQRNYIVVSVSYIITFLQYIVQGVLLFTTHNYLLYVLAQTFFSLTYNIVISVIATKNFPIIKSKNVKPLPKDEKKSLFSNVRDLLIYKISSILVNSTDNILITFFKGLASTGIVSNYTLISSTINSLLSQIFNGLTASIGNHNALGSDEEKYEMFSFCNLMNFWLFGWASIGFVFCSQDVVNLVFGEDYVLPINIPIIIAINFYMVGMMNAVWTYKHTLGLFRYGRSIQFFTGIINIVLSVLIGNYLGVFGILLATTFSRLFTSVWYDPYAVFKHGFNKSPMKYYFTYVFYILVMLLISLICCAVFYFIHCHILLQCIIKIILCSVIFNLVFCIIFHKKREYKKFREILFHVLTIFKNKLGRAKYK